MTSQGGTTADARWFELAEPSAVASPALLLYPERIAENLRRIIQMAGGPGRLRPHVKTHKLPQVVRMQQALGIDKFKCATLAEAEMLGRCQVADALVGLHVVGPNVARLVELVRQFPKTRWSVLADDATAIDALSQAMVAAGTQIETLLDIDAGMHRTGVAPGEQASALYRRLHDLPGLLPGGLHVYDGNIKDRDAATRRAHVEQAMAPVHALADVLTAQGLPVPRIVAGGTPTFPAHAADARRECSPGTCVLWDASYTDKFPDLQFLFAAVLLTRIVSKPTSDRLCVDLGYKAVSADNPDPRAVFFDLPDAQALIHNEEHLTVSTAHAGNYRVGDVLYAVPWHVCPTCALHQEAIVVEGGRVVDRWPIDARNRRLSI